MNVRTSRLGLVAVTIALAGTLLGCSSGSDSSGGGGGSADSAAVAPAPAAAKPPASAPGARTSTDSIALQPALIRTAQLTVVVADVTGRATEAASTARAAGGVVAGDDRSGSGADAHATLVLKVPPGRMDAVLDQLSRLGTEESRSSSTEDVTEDVADISSRVATMQASIARVRAILARAEKIGDVVSVEGELSRRTTELEALQARQRALAGQVNYATITLQLRARSAAAATPPAERGGFLGGLTGGWDAFTATVGALLTGIGAVLPFLLVLVPAALAARWVLRRRSVSAAPTAPAPQPE
ncbi:MAG TPA: DUF4349 domain-containing protein [Mycobacteriales bacterium]